MFMIGFLLTAAVIAMFGLFLTVGTAFCYTAHPQRTVRTEFGEATIPEISEEKLIPRLRAFGLRGILPGFVLAVGSVK